MATHASRDTITGLIFEKKVKPLVNNGGQDISKKRLKQFCADMGIGDIVQYLSWSFEPDIAYYDPHTKSVHIYEIKFQQTSGSADEKLGACAWKIEEYKSLFSAIGIYQKKRKNTPTSNYEIIKWGMNFGQLLFCLNLYVYFTQKPNHQPHICFFLCHFSL